MKVVVALDKFKGSLTASDACDIVRRGLLRIDSDTRIVSKPMADGGDGTAAALQASLGGQWITRQVTGPLPGRTVTARYLWLPEQQQAIIEMAQASGLVLLDAEERNPLLTTTYGTGELLADAIDQGSRRVWLTIGGSATVDGGVGAAMALGWQFLDARRTPIGLGGGALANIDSIVSPRRRWPAVEVLCDVDNPLCGEHGAAHVFGPQKGATPRMVEQLDAALRHLAILMRQQLGKDVLDVPGAGAAGGLAAGAIAFLDAKLVPGIQTVMAVSGLAADVADADWVITGEGQLDEQSLRGKVVGGVTALATKYGARVAVLAGRVQLSEDQWRRAGIAIARPIAPPKMTTADAMNQAEPLLFAAAQEIASLFRRAD